MCLNYMTDNLFILYLIILFIIIIGIYINKNCKEKFTEHEQNKNDLRQMFNDLDEWEQKCNSIEEKYQIKNDIYKIKQNEIAFNQLEELDKKIYELTEIVKDLTNIKKQRDGINKECQKDTQIKLNRNYAVANDLNKTGISNKQNIDLDFNISDALKSYNKNNINNGKKKCDIKNKKDYINLDKTNIEDKCYKCDGDKLKENYQYLNKDFN